MVALAGCVEQGGCPLLISPAYAAGGSELQISEPAAARLPLCHALLSSPFFFYCPPAARLATCPLSHPTPWHIPTPAGYRDYSQLRTDPDLEGLRGDERFENLLKRFERAEPAKKSGFLGLF